eukprot:Platyproteum_vivax@DN15094_c0_g1_i1.p1
MADYLYSENARNQYAHLDYEADNEDHDLAVMNKTALRYARSQDEPLTLKQWGNTANIEAYHRDAFFFRIFETQKSMLFNRNLELQYAKAETAMDSTAERRRIIERKNLMSQRFLLHNRLLGVPPHMIKQTNRKG